ncbi:MAG: hypothetical protein PHX68_01590 [Alphaproteobacteria bacterium]|nr:hypothetical protein [Alphaproteobacteria bacterium]
MGKQKNPFAARRDTLWNRAKRPLILLVVFMVLSGGIWCGARYVKQAMPAYAASYFNVPAARVSADMLSRYAESLRGHLSFPLGLPQYVSAQMASATAHTKLSMLEAASAFVAGLMGGLVSVLAVLLLVYAVFKLMKYHKARSSEDRVARLVVKKLLPVLDEMNRNVLDVRDRLAALESEKRSGDGAK